MPCFFWILGLGIPRLILLGLWLFSDFVSRAFPSIIWPALGFVFAPLTTLAYGFAKNANGSVSGFYLVLVILAALVDLGFVGGSGLLRRKKK